MFNKKHRKPSKDQDNQSTRSKDSITETISNPSTPKRNNKKLQIQKSNILDYSSSDEDDWKTEFTRSIRQDDTQPNEEAHLTKTNLKQKYPKQVKNVKAGTVKVKLKDDSNAKYEDLCAICLDKYSGARGHLGCGHKFCFQCIQEWVKSSTRCPCCREGFKEYVKVTVDQSHVQTKREILKVEERVLEFSEQDWYICYECENGDDEDVLLLCDICDFYCCHVYCDPSLHNLIPEGEWYCEKCREVMNINERENEKELKNQKKEPKKQSKKPDKKIRKPIINQHSSEDEEYQEQEKTPSNIRITRSMSNMQINQARSKAYEIINKRPNMSRNRFAEEMERVTNNTAMNLRNLRRRRIS